jgi:HK97 family phage prohead protease
MSNTLITTKSQMIVPRPPEYKSVSFRVKAVDDKRGIIRGFLNVIGNIDDGHDRTMSGAFYKTLSDAYSRKSAQHLDYLYPYLWNHDPGEPPIGGIFDADEVKAKGNEPAGLFAQVQLILDIERARDVYACFKSQEEGSSSSSGLLKQSIGYKTIRYEFVKEDGETVRNLIELQLWEGSSCIFPMNELAVVTDVKSQGQNEPRFYNLAMNTKSTTATTPLETKTICGNTSGPIGPRDEAWDGSEAEKQIWAAAYNEDTGKINEALCRKYFMNLNGDPQKKGSWNLPFWYVGDNPHICVGAVKAIAGWVQGARG